MCNQVFNTRQPKTLRRAEKGPNYAAAKTVALQTQPTMQEYYSPVKADRPKRLHEPHNIDASPEGFSEGFPVDDVIRFGASPSARVGEK